MTVGGGRRGPRLSPDDVALWDGVTRSVRPLRKRVPRAEATPEPVSVPRSKKPIVAAAPPQAPRSSPKNAAPPAAGLERKLKQRIARGHDAIDARLDLHGHTQAEAHDVLLRVLRRTQARGDRVVLVITGKGGRGESERGVLKRAVPLWLALPEFRALVLGFDQAAASHGGEGALYVRLRKGREHTG